MWTSLSSITRRAVEHRPRGLALAGLAAVALGVAGCSVPAPPGAAPLRYRDAIFPAVTVTSGLQYGASPASEGTPQALTLDMYRPTSDAQAKRPAVVWIHGGGFKAGSPTNANTVTLATEFAKRGYVSVSINYRLLAKSTCGGQTTIPPDCVIAASAAQHDAQAAVRWLRAHAAAYGIDATRVGVGGSSAGAVTALLVGTRSDDPGASGNPAQSSKVSGAVAISGLLPTNEAIDAADAPTLMFNGTADPIVSFSGGAQTAGWLYSAGVPIVFEDLQGAGHVPFAQYGDLFVTQSANFFYAFMDLAHAQGQPAAAARAFERQAARLRAAHPRFVR